MGVGFNDLLISIDGDMIVVMLLEVECVVIDECIV